MYQPASGTAFVLGNAAADHLWFLCRAVQVWLFQVTIQTASKTVAVGELGVRVVGDDPAQARQHILTTVAAGMRVAPRRARVFGKDAITTADFLEEVAVSQYALHAGLHLQHITTVWRDLWGHIATQLCTGKVPFSL